MRNSKLIQLTQCYGSELEQSAPCSCLPPAKNLEQDYHTCFLYFLLIFLGSGRIKGYAAAISFIWIYTFHDNFNLLSWLRFGFFPAKAYLLPWYFLGHWHNTVSTPWYSPSPMMAVAGIAPLCVLRTMQPFDRVMLTEDKKHLILHFSMLMYCIAQSCWEYKGHSCSVKCGLCCDYQTRIKFLSSFFFFGIRLSHFLSSISLLLP